MKLVICEKPLIAKAVAEAIDSNYDSKDNTYIAKDYIVVWAYGHLLTLKDPEDYDEKYKKWNIEHLPIYFENWGNKIKKGSSERVRQIKNLSKEADCIINAGDIDEEGQLLVDELIRWIGYSGKVLRLDTADTSIAAMKKALNSLKDNDLYVKDGYSAYARQVADIIFGYNLTRFYSCKNRNLFSVGRVQSATLGLVCQRYLDIKNFKKNYYYELFVSGKLNGITVKSKFYFNKEDYSLSDGLCLDKDYIEEKSNDLKKTYPGKIEKKTIKETPPLPFNINKLNTYCNKKFGYSPKQVMTITQNLREKYAAITYNRSDCQYLTEEHYKEAPEVIESCCTNLNIDNMFDTSIKSKCFNNSNVTAHFGIIPTSEKVNIDDMTSEEQNVYISICNFYLIQFLPEKIKEKTTLKVDLGSGEKLEASSTAVIEEGYNSFFKSKEEFEDEEFNDNISSLNPGIYDYDIEKKEIVQKETKPSKPFNKTTLFNAMGSISKYVTDQEIKKLLIEKDKEKKGENGSIGTVATRTAIIERLFEVGYLTEVTVGKKKIIEPTEKGLSFFYAIPEEIKQPNLTAKWWVIQENIKTGENQPKDLAESVLEYVSNIIENNDGKIDFKQEAAKIICKCPKCGKNIVKGKFGPYCEAKCGFSQKYVFGKEITDAQLKDLCEGKRIYLKNLKSKSGKKYNAYFKPGEIVKYEYMSKGKKYEGYQFDLKMEF